MFSQDALIFLSFVFHVCCFNFIQTQCSNFLRKRIAFLFISTDSVRYRPLMIPAVLEKVTYSAAIIVLVLQNRTHPSDLVFAATDVLLGSLFVVAYFKTPSRTL